MTRKQAPDVREAGKLLMQAGHVQSAGHRRPRGERGPAPHDAGFLITPSRGRLQVTYRRASTDLYDKQLHLAMLAAYRDTLESAGWTARRYSESSGDRLPEESLILIVTAPAGDPAAAAPGARE